MPVVRSFGTLEHVNGAAPRAATGGTAGAAPTSWALDAPAFSTYAALYRTQPSVRTVVDFLARNIAQLGLHVFRRVSDTDRVRLFDHELAQWIEKPNPAMTRYRLIENLMADLGIYYTAYWLKVRMPNRLGFVRLPPETVEPLGWLLPEGFVWTKPDGTQQFLAPRDLVYFNGYNPANPIIGLSPLETLRRTLAEECAATSYREAYWKNAARLEGVVERPRDAPRWTTDQKQTWREQWAARFSGKPGQVAVLEDGMIWKQAGSTFRDSEFTAVRKLSREEVAAEYHIPLPMVGILDHATFSNIKEQHKQLYQDALGPWLVNLQEEFERQLLPECDDVDHVYTEFNIAEKLKGSFEEQADSLQRLCGRPIMTGNEGRSRLNLPAMKDDPTMDEVVFSLNTSSPSGSAAGDEPVDPKKTKALPPADDQAAGTPPAWVQ